MRKIILPVLLMLGIQGTCQDNVKLRQIDSLVNAIKQSNFATHLDTIVQDYPDLGLYMKTYLTSVMNGSELKSYVNHVISTRQEKGNSTQMISTNAFYFDAGKLIKVEEEATDGAKEMHADWYYTDNKPLYYTFKSDKSEDRAALLLTLGETILKQFHK